MRLLLDQGLPRSAVRYLEGFGYDAVHVGDIGHSMSQDAEILDFAGAQSRIVVANDADFHQILAITGADGPSVIRVRIEGLKGQAIATLLADLLPEFEAELHDGCVLTVKPGQARVRKLPLLP